MLLKLKYMFATVVAWGIAIFTVVPVHQYCIIGSLHFDRFLYQVFIILFSILIFKLFTKYTLKTIAISLFILSFIPIILVSLNLGEFNLETLSLLLVTDNLGKFIGILLGYGIFFLSQKYV